MKWDLTSALIVLLLIVPGCGESYTPPEPTAEDAELAKELSVYTEQLKAALGKSGDYVQVAIIDRNYSVPNDEGMPEEYSRVLVLHREVLDLDDYGFSLPGKETSEAEADYVAGFFGEVMFWVDADANIFIDDYDQPPGTDLVVEWLVPNSVGDRVSLHFGGNPCVVIDLSE